MQFMKKLFVHSLFFLSVSSMTYGQDFNLTGAGARAEGLGGAFIGLADDATAISWNPAGLTQLERPEASIVTRIISEKTSYKDDIDPSYNTEVSQGHFSLNFGSFAAPISTGETKIVAALAWQRQIDLYSTQTLQNGSETDKQESKGGVNTFTPGFAALVGQMISIGMSANIWTGTWNNTDTYTYSDGSSINNVSEVKFSGLNFVFGGLIDFEGKKNGTPLKLGVSMKTPFTLKGEVSNTPVTMEFEMPFMIGFGGSYRFGDNLTLAMDYEMRSYADKKVSISGGGGISIARNISESGNNLNEIRVGAEYLIVLEQSVIPLRLGFKSVPTTLADQTYNYITNNFESTTNQVKGSAVSIGSGYITDAFALDITLSSISYSQKYESLGQIDFLTGILSTSLIIYF
jgi:hypothetical protein